MVAVIAQRSMHSTELELEYKYVVRDENNNAAYWKPGTNCSVALPFQPNARPSTVKVADDWDECVSQVEVGVVVLSSANAWLPQVDYPSGTKGVQANGEPTTLTYSFSEGEVYQPAGAFEFQDEEVEEEVEQPAPQEAPQEAAAAAAPASAPPAPAKPPAVVGADLDEVEMKAVAAAADRAMQVCDGALRAHQHVPTEPGCNDSAVGGAD